MCHITGGGLTENIPRILPDDLCAVIEQNAWQWPEIFKWLQAGCGQDNQEMMTTFNCGIGYVDCS